MKRISAGRSMSAPGQTINGRPVTPFSALAPFATDNIQRRQPWAVTDNAGMLWLFWLELVSQQWQFRYNRYDGTNWAFAVRRPRFLSMLEPTHASKVLRLSCFTPIDTAQPPVGFLGANRTDRSARDTGAGVSCTGSRQV